MAVVSDSWPDLEDLFRRLELHGFFQTFVISAILGCRKPDPRMYRAGSDGLGLPPHECLFIDDDPELVTAATDLGYQGITLSRDRNPPATTTTPRITSLDDLIAIING
jgi:HAD superfamily hydrolase (TIGR01509 family)